MAAALSRECGLLARDEAARVRRLLERAGLPTRSAAVTPAAVLEHMSVDKKVLGGRLRLVLLRAIGDAFLTDRKSTRLNSSHSQISYAVFCLKKKKKQRAVTTAPSARRSEPSTART